MVCPPQSVLPAARVRLWHTALLSPRLSGLSQTPHRLQHQIPASLPALQGRFGHGPCAPPASSHHRVHWASGQDWNDHLLLGRHSTVTHERLGSPKTMPWFLPRGKLLLGLQSPAATPLARGTLSWPLLPAQTAEPYRVLGSHPGP